MADTNLVNIVKEHLNITWCDAETDAHVISIINNAKITICNKLGLENDFNFSNPSQEQALFLNYILYFWNNATSDFDYNYRNEIMQLRRKREVEEYAERQES